MSRDVRATSWRGLGRWGAGFRANQDCGDHQVGMVGWDDGEHWGSGEGHPGTPGIVGERLDMAKGAGV
jgi:hypothetical protein